MKNIFTILLPLVFFSQFSAQNKLTVKLEESTLLNEFIQLDSTEKSTYKKFLSELDVSLVEEYLKLMVEMNFEKADSLIQQDEKLKKIPERAIVLFYIYFYAHQNNLLDLYALLMSDENNEISAIVFMNELDYSKYSKLLNQEIKIMAQLIIDLPLVKTKLYLMK